MGPKHRRTSEEKLQENAITKCSSRIHKCQNDLKDTYLTFIRSVLEQSAVVWHSSLTQKNRQDLERVQKAAVRVIMGRNYTTYKNGLIVLKLDTLEKRRELLCLRFAKNCIKTEKVKDLFPLNNSKHGMKMRKVKKYKTNKQNTNRLKKLRNVILACPVLLTFSFKIVGCDISVNLPSF